MAKRGESHPARSPVFAAYAGNSRNDEEVTVIMKSIIACRMDILSLDASKTNLPFQSVKK